MSSDLSLQDKRKGLVANILQEFSLKIHLFNINSAIYHVSHIFSRNANKIKRDPEKLILIN